MEQKFPITKVAKVIDGDTVKVQLQGLGSRTVRLSGNDAPEKDQIGGSRSTAFLEVLLKDGRFFVELTEPQTQQGRLYGLIYCEGDNDPLDSINAKMVVAGWAHAYGKYYQITGLEELEKEAREAKKGLWGLSPKPSYQKSRGGSGGLHTMAAADSEDLLLWPRRTAEDLLLWPRRTAEDLLLWPLVLQRRFIK